MTRIETPAHSDSLLAGASGLVSSSDPGVSTSTSSSKHRTNLQGVGSVEAISTNTLHGMLVQVLEQNAALWKAQASTNHILDELRQSITAPQESADAHERLCRLETVVAGLHPTSTQETARVSPTPHARRMQDKDGVPVTRVVPPSAHGDLLITAPVISPEKIFLSLFKTDRAPAMAGGQSHQGPLEESDRKPSPPRSFEKYGIVQSSRSRAKDSISMVSVRDQDQLAEDYGGRHTNYEADGPTAERNEARDPGIEKAMPGNTYKHEVTMEYKDLFQTLSDAWRVDIQRLKDEIISAVRATASEQVPYNIQGCLDEFSKVLATEVRSLLNEVGMLREERQRIRHEVGYPMTLRPGEFGADRLPGYSSPVAPTGVPFTEGPIPRPAWRTLPTRGRRHPRKGRVPPPPQHSWVTWQPNPALAPTPPPVGREHSWCTWQPNPALAPTPPPVEPTLPYLDRRSPGLFGPRSPCDSYRELPSPSQQPGSQVSRKSAWSASDHWDDLSPPLSPIPSPPSKVWDLNSEDGWIRCYSPLHNPALAPSPPSTNIGLVPEYTSTGLPGRPLQGDSSCEFPEQIADPGNQSSRDPVMDGWGWRGPHPPCSPTPSAAERIRALERDIFGPDSPCGSYREPPSQIEQSTNDAPRVPLRVACELASPPPPPSAEHIRTGGPTIPVQERRNPRLFGSPRHIPWVSGPSTEPDIPDVRAWMRQVRHGSEHSSLFGPSRPAP